ncbi:MAG: chemotaxis protein CheD [Planctomycetes bacterium]|nr:chemotaxis protein CheD [Planctomycetota bacterium]
MSATLGANDLVVAIAEARVEGAAARRRLLTYGVGSCIAIAAWDEVARVGGLLHFMLPAPRRDREREIASTRPGVFATTGVAALLQQLAAAGAEIPRLRLAAAGAAELVQAGPSSVGAQNRVALITALQTAGLELRTGVFGGTASRTVALDLSTGAFEVRPVAGQARVGRRI